MSIEILDDNFMVCVDCASIIANDDPSSFDYHYGPDEAEKIEAKIREAIQTHHNDGNFINIGEHERDLEFSRTSCDCCGSTLHGYRHHAYLVTHHSETYNSEA